MNDPMNKTARFSLWLLKAMMQSQHVESYIGDINEEFMERADRDGHKAALNWLWRHTLTALPNTIIYKLTWGFFMLRHELKTAARLFLRQKGYSIINILGLSVGIASCLAILAYVHFQMSYDRDVKNSGRIYRVTLDGQLGGTAYASARIPAPAAPLLAGYPEVERVVRLIPDNLNMFRFRDKLVYNSFFFFAGPEALQMFPRRFIKGDSENALRVPNSVVIDEKTAVQFFGSEDPMGRVICYNDMLDLTVTGVMETGPANTHLPFSMLISFSTLQEWWPFVMKSRTFTGSYTYLMLKKGVDGAEFSRKVSSFFKEKLNDLADKEGGHLIGGLQPVRSIHLHSHRPDEWVAGGNSAYVYAFLAVGLLIMVIAAINYVNLTTARAGIRGKEIGLRKVLGASRYGIIRQLTGESVLFGLISLIFAALILLSANPFIRSLMGSQFSLGTFLNPVFMIQVALLFIVVSIIAGGYPAVYLSRFQPKEAIKGTRSGGKTRSRFRNGLVVFQFVILIGLMIMTLGIRGQMYYFQNQNLGFDKNQLLSLKLFNDHSDPDAWMNRMQSLKNELKKLSAVNNATFSSHVPGIRFREGQFEWEGVNGRQNQMMETYEVDVDFAGTFKIPVVHGRDFDKRHATDEVAVLINETAAAKLGWNDPVGRRLVDDRGEERKERRIIGVVKDFHSRSLHHEIKPLVIIPTDHFHYLTLNVETSNIQGILGQIEAIWKRFNPDYPLEHFFLDDKFQELYSAESRMGRVMEMFTLIAVIIGCLGLVGLVSFATQQRTKEIGIRKSIGASTGNIMGLFFREYGLILLAANLLAWPLAWFALSRWMEGFAYRTEIGAGLFLMATGIAAFIGTGTIAYWVVRSARVNPVESLKYE